MTIAFIGWFGPRGLASVVFALLAVEALGHTDSRVKVTINTIAVTIVFSIVPRVTARPLATRYVATLHPTARRTPDRWTPRSTGGGRSRLTRVSASRITHARRPADHRASFR